MRTCILKRIESKGAPLSLIQFPKAPDLPLSLPNLSTLETSTIQGLCLSGVENTHLLWGTWPKIKKNLSFSVAWHGGEERILQADHHFRA